MVRLRFIAAYLTLGRVRFVARELLRSTCALESARLAMTALIGESR